MYNGLAFIPDWSKEMLQCLAMLSHIYCIYIYADISSPRNDWICMSSDWYEESVGSSRVLMNCITKNVRTHRPGESR